MHDPKKFKIRLLEKQIEFYHQERKAVMRRQIHILGQMMKIAKELEELKKI
jgi:hypothetical protein